MFYSIIKMDRTRMIYRKGNLIDAAEPLIAHGTNCMGKMGSGVAKAIRRAFPEAYLTYRHLYETDGLQLGKVQFVYSRDKIIANCNTQKFYGYDGNQYCDYGAITNCFMEVEKYCKEHNIKVVAIPK